MFSCPTIWLAVGKCNLEYFQDRRETHCKKFAQGLGDNVKTSPLPPSRFQKFEKFFQSVPVPNENQSLEKQPCALLCFTFKHNLSPFPELQFVSFSQYFFFDFSICSQWMLAHAHVHTCALTSICRVRPCALAHTLCSG